MNKHHIAVAVLGVLQGLAGADRDHADFDSRLFGEDRENMLEQPGVLGRGGRLHDDELVLGSREERIGGSEQSSAQAKPKKLPSVHHPRHRHLPLEHKAASNERPPRLALRLIEETLCCAMLDNAPVVQEDDVLREPACLAHVMRHHNDLDALPLRLDQKTLDQERRGGIEACRWFIEEQNCRLKAERPHKAKPLLLAA
jgi:hypothetical protein